MALAQLSNKKLASITRIPSAQPVKVQQEIEIPKSVEARNKFRVEQVKSEHGSKIIGHPDYKFTSRHSNNPEVYIPARQEYLNAVALLAQADREKNPTWRRAQAIQTTLNTEH